MRTVFFVSHTGLNRTNSDGAGCLWWKPALLTPIADYPKGISIAGDEVVVQLFDDIDNLYDFSDNNQTNNILTHYSHTVKEYFCIPFKEGVEPFLSYKENYPSFFGNAYIQSALQYLKEGTLTKISSLADIPSLPSPPPLPPTKVTLPEKKRRGRPPKNNPTQQTQQPEQTQPHPQAQQIEEINS